MNRNNEVLLRGAHKNQRGQVLIFVTLWFPVLFGMTALVVDFGRMYFFNNELRNSTQAAALAGAYAMSQAGATVASTTSAVTAYSGTSGNDNADVNLPSVSILSGYPQFKCLATLTTLYGLSCYGPSNSNAIAVAQQVRVPLLFFPMFGGYSATLTATATAAMKGSSAAPWNIAVIIDSTHSMNDLDSDSNCDNTRLSCALAGARILLSGLSPCLTSESTCGAATSGNVANAVDRTSLFTFPTVLATTAVDDYNCGSTNPTIEPYTTTMPATYTYQIVGFSSDYRTSDTATSLNSSSNLVAAVGGKSGCAGMQAPGGAGTYYAQVIYSAQNKLVAEQALYPNSKNAMVILSDGDANATTAQMVGASATSGTFMSSIQECHQAVTAAQVATAAGTRVYSVAYGAEASGCPTDTSPTITPCQTMEQMASAPQYFFSDYTATGSDSSCVSASQPVTGLNAIFSAIVTDLTEVKLVPNNTT
jgi:Flp pilus assembly protein TadG